MGGAGVNPHTCKTGTLFRISLALSVPIFNKKILSGTSLGMSQTLISTLIVVKMIFLFETLLNKYVAQIAIAHEMKNRPNISIMKL